MGSNMTNDEFEAIVKDLELRSAQRPGAYKLKVLLLALLGYAYIGFIIATMAGLLGLASWGILSGKLKVNFLIFKLAAPLLILAGIILRALWVDIPRPTGIPLKRESAASLFDAVDRLRRALKSPTVHEVLITEDFNASVAQIPRLGILGWHKNYLTIGLPLMQALSPSQFQAVIAHEFGHLSGSHGRFSSWIYRTRITWHQLMVQLEERDHWGSFIFTRFFEWYAPYFAAYTFVLARAQEYEADKRAAETLGTENVADMLISLEISDARLQEEFWPSIYKVAEVEDEPPSDVYLEMQRTFHSEVASDLGQRWLQRALLGETDCLDTHPSLSDRLRALRQEPRLPRSMEESAAEHFRARTADDDLNRNWKTAIRGSWKERYKYARESKQRLSELEEKAESDSLTVEEAWQRACWTEEFRDVEAALPLYQQVLGLKSDHPAALFSIGRLLLERDQPEGIDQIEKAIQLNVEYTLVGCQLVCSFLVEKGRKQEAQAFYERAISPAPRLGDIGSG